MRYFSSIRIQTLLTIFIAGVVNAGYYASRVDRLFIDLKSKYPDNTDCVNNAHVKMAKFLSTYDEDKQRAVALVNLYTQSCKLKNKLENKCFYDLLNSNLRTGHPAPFWETAEHLLNQGIVLLKESDFVDLYRHCGTFYEFKPGTLVRFPQFLSTSLPKWDAYFFNFKSWFCSSVMIFNIKDAVGLDVSAYSAISGEKEVLIKSSSVFEVVSSSDKIFYYYVVLRYKAQAYGPVTDLTYECALTTSAVSIGKCVFSIIVIIAVTAAFVWKISRYVG